MNLIIGHQYKVRNHGIMTYNGMARNQQDEILYVFVNDSKNGGVFVNEIHAHEITAI
jgi:hypothetical protein